MNVPLTMLKWAAIVMTVGGGAVALLLIARDPASLPARYWSRYVAYLDRKLRTLFVTTQGRHVALGQLGVMLATIAAALALQEHWLYLAVAVWPFAPAVTLEQMRRQRVRAIESKIDGFILSLANALKATPSIGNALGYTQPLLAPPLDVEVALALKEMRLGSTVDQVLLGMAGRIRSVQLDAALSSLLIGRQVGGDLPKILEKTAETLREMARLQGVVRSKTAEGKAQLVVLALFPGVLVVLFDTVSKGYFDPLTRSVGGWIVIAVAISLWIASILMARKVLAVDI